MLKKYNAKSLTDAKDRYNNLYSISPDLDLGNGLTNAAYLEYIQKFDAAENSYNRLKAELSRERAICIDLVPGMKVWNKRMLAGVATKFGEDSEEYAQAGGTKTTDRKKSKRKAVKNEPSV
jgi:hypothetical protein